jgi:adenylate cyclase
MGIEIERKFLVDRERWTPEDEGTLYRQGYLSDKKDCVVRVRIAGDEAYLTVKGASEGVTRLEFEYPIPRPDAEALLERLCEQPLVEKTRRRVSFRGKIWEIDTFHGDNEGLVLAEVELSAEDERLDLPPWIDREVSDDPRYFNSNLARLPYTRWGEP